MITTLDELAIDGEGKFYLSIEPAPSHDPVEVTGVMLDIRAIYP